MLRDQGITGDGGKEIDHVELFGSAQLAGADSKNFVLCPGKAYDRSPCGTGTSAKLACLYADGKIRKEQIWRQESIIGSVFEGSVKVRDGKIYPSITGAAFVNAEAELVLDPRDPFCMGISA
jgi:4-hydroxyproline epimerase